MIHPIERQIRSMLPPGWSFKWGKSSKRNTIALDPIATMNKPITETIHEVMTLIKENEYTVKEYAGLKSCHTSYIYKLWKLVKTGKKTKEEVGFELVKQRGINLIKPMQ
jgi:hypothetical protein